MNESAEKAQQGYKFYKAHVLKAQEFPGSDIEYCRQNGLNQSTFSTYKKRLGLTRSFKPRREAFIKVAPSQMESTPAVNLTAHRALPDAKWTAQFVLSLLGDR